MSRIFSLGSLSMLGVTLALGPASATVPALPEVQRIDSGWRVAVSGETAVIGAPRADSMKGAAYVFERNQVTGVWEHVKKLSPADLEPLKQFGDGVAIDGDTVVVGTWRANSNTGAAYVFEREEGGPNMWGQVAKLEPSVLPGEPAGFGYSVGVGGERIIVGAPYAIAAYIFERQGDGSWPEAQRLDGFPTDFGQGFVVDDFFGIDVDIADDTVVVGARANAAGTIFSPLFDVGAAHIFERNQGTGVWEHVKKLVTDVPQAGGFFGQHVGIDGDTVIVGGYLWDDPLKENSGGAWVFERDLGGLGNWGEAQKLEAADVEAGDFFGFDVSIEGDLAVVGAQRKNSFTGAAYVFYKNSSWEEVQKLVASDPTPGASFGADTSVSGATVFIGAVRITPGSAYVFGSGGNSDTDGDGLPDDQDLCNDSDLNPTVIIDGIDSTVENTLFGDGCTIADLIALLAADATTHGDFVSAVAELLNSLKMDGVLTGQEKGLIQSAAAQAEIP